MNKKYNNKKIKELIKTEWFNQFELFAQKEILAGLEKDLDVSIYAKPEYSWDQMKQISSGLEEGLDVLIYANPDFKSTQMFQIRLGLLLDKTDISIYAKLGFNAKQMELIRIGLRLGLDVSIYAIPVLSEDQMEKIFKALLEKETVSQTKTLNITVDNVDVSITINQNQNANIEVDKDNKLNIIVK